jgi:hypothetical protein
MSKSKTFDAQAELGEIVDWVVSQIQTEDREIPYGGAEPSLDVRTETTKKYKITIQEIVL